MRLSNTELPGNMGRDKATDRDVEGHYEILRTLHRLFYTTISYRGSVPVTSCDSTRLQRPVSPSPSALSLSPSVEQLRSSNLQCRRRHQRSRMQYLA
ncbi:hypothetical protein ALC56_13693 [Trachymyrmex septentrionalis]|uniref:Uncharacterized protein n=1 Tax=Trachymyrmex septentrionalis TaxID=34720 RepID=A0A195EUK7_9HYME|nr:hypothetical protein ALC56_13693 [Trachymyrmex septentrionalis]